VGPTGWRHSNGPPAVPTEVGQWTSSTVGQWARPNPEWRGDRGDWVGGRHGDSGGGLTRGPVGEVILQTGWWALETVGDTVGETGDIPWGETESYQVHNTGIFARYRTGSSSSRRPTTTLETGGVLSAETRCVSSSVGLPETRPRRPWPRWCSPRKPAGARPTVPGPPLRSSRAAVLAGSGTGRPPAPFQSARRVAAAGVTRGVDGQ
jgi:hypothetical protein